MTATRQRARDRSTRAGYAFLSPWLIGFLGLTAGPMIASLYLSFTDYNLFTAPEFIGIENYQRLLTDSNFHQAAKVTALYVVFGTPIKLAAAL